MLRTLKELFDSFIVQEPTPAERQHALQLSTAVLLVEVMRADASADAAERGAVESALRRIFTLTDDELAQLMAQAERSAKYASDYFQFSSNLNTHFDHAQKIRVIEAMWQVAYADNRLDPNEHTVINKIAGLLHVTHGEYIGAKLRAKEAAWLN